MTFTLTSTVMEVPEHIYVNGVGNHRPRSFSMNNSESTRVLESMRVPDRIVLAGGNSHLDSRAAPPEIMADKADNLFFMSHSNVVPQTITAYDIYERTDNVRSDNAASESSIAIEEAPIRELKVMKRQLIQLASRVTQLEDSNSSRATRETALWITLISSLTFIATLVFQKKLPFPKR